MKVGFSSLARELLLQDYTPHGRKAATTATQGTAAY
jgi:hypothetical protein